MPTDYWFPDNSVVINFAVVDRLELLRASLRGRGRVTEAVWREIGDSAQRVPNLAKLDRADWFGSPIRIEGDSNSLSVEGIRLGVFGASRIDPPTLHLGESQTIHIIGTDPDFAGSVWMTEDVESLRYAKARGLIAYDTLDILQSLVAFGELSASDAFSIAEEMLSCGRPLHRAPRSASDFS